MIEPSPSDSSACVTRPSSSVKRSRSVNPKASTRNSIAAPASSYKRYGVIVRGTDVLLCVVFR